MYHGLGVFSIRQIVYYSHMLLSRKLLLWALFAFISVAVLYPNPFSNNPDIIWDESYFLTTALSSIQHHTLPGWEFSESGAYYGGVQAYIDTMVIVPAVGFELATHHFSMTDTQVWVAQNTGSLLHLLRIVSGVSALAALLFCFFYFKKKNISRSLVLSLSLFLGLILSNTLVIECLHTTKMWALYIVMVSVTGAFFIAQEYSLRHGEAVMEKKRYTAFLIWSGILTFYQSYVGAFSILLLFFYALFLKHIAWRDVWNHVRSWWLLMALSTITQISFVVRAYELRHQFAGVATTTASGAIDWATRLLKPLEYTVLGQPLSVLYVLSLLILAVYLFTNKRFFEEENTRNRIIVAVVHPVLTYLFFHIGIGFDILPRYAIPVTLACSFSIVILMAELGRRATQFALAASILLSMIVLGHAILLYWQPSSETILLQTIERNYNSPSNIFIVDHSARRMTLPVNRASLHLLDADRQAMSRFQYLLQHENALPTDEPFKALTATAYVPAEQAAYLKQFETVGNAVWVVSVDCTQRCEPAETAAGKCFELNTQACNLQPQEINTLPIYIEADQLGFSYIVRRVY